MMINFLKQNLSIIILILIFQNSDLFGMMRSLKIARTIQTTRIPRVLTRFHGTLCSQNSSIQRNKSCTSIKLHEENQHYITLVCKTRLDNIKKIESEFFDLFLKAFDDYDKLDKQSQIVLHQELNLSLKKCLKGAYSLLNTKDSFFDNLLKLDAIERHKFLVIIDAILKNSIKYVNSETKIISYIENEFDELVLNSLIKIFKTCTTP